MVIAVVHTSGVCAESAHSLATFQDEAVQEVYRHTFPAMPLLFGEPQRAVSVRTHNCRFGAVVTQGIWCQAATVVGMTEGQYAFIQEQSKQSEHLTICCVVVTAVVVFIVAGACTSVQALTIHCRPGGFA